MKNKTYLIAACILCLLIFLLHLIAGQMSLVDPMQESNMIAQQKVEWLGAWHMITLLLAFIAFKLFQQSKKTVQNIELLHSIELLCYLFALAFVGASIWRQQFAPQWTLFIGLGLLINGAIGKQLKSNTNENSPY